MFLSSELIFLLQCQHPIRIPVQVSAAPIPVQFPDNVLQKAAANGTTTWDPVTHMRDLDKAPGCGFNPSSPRCIDICRGEAAHGREHSLARSLSLIHSLSFSLICVCHLYVLQFCNGQSRSLRLYLLSSLVRVRTWDSSSLLVHIVRGSRGCHLLPFGEPTSSSRLLPSL